MVSTAKPGQVAMLVQRAGGQTNADVSPDGRWLAYQSDESGRDEIYVRPFPAVDSGQWQVSTSGGSRPVWARNGRELYFLDATLHLVAVPILSGATFASGTPVTLFDLPSTPTATARTYDVAPDGRFLVIKFPESGNSAGGLMVNVVINWLEELKQLRPAGN
jgi:serine/threonine-protein kinase